MVLSPMNAGELLVGGRYRQSKPVLPQKPSFTAKTPRDNSLPCLACCKHSRLRRGVSTLEGSLWWDLASGFLGDSQEASTWALRKLSDIPSVPAFIFHPRCLNGVAALHCIFSQGRVKRTKEVCDNSAEERAAIAHQEMVPISNPCPMVGAEVQSHSENVYIK